MGIIFAANWDQLAGLQAKHGQQYGDDYNTLGDCSYQQMTTMLITWANREIQHNNGVILRDLATTIKSAEDNVTVEIGFHQRQTFDGIDYFHVTVTNPYGATVHMFSRANIHMGGIAHIEKSFCGGSTNPNTYEERFYYWGP